MSLAYLVPIAAAIVSSAVFYAVMRLVQDSRRAVVRIAARKGTRYSRHG